MVDFDLTRRELEVTDYPQPSFTPTHTHTHHTHSHVQSIKAKPKVTDQKIQQAEEAYTNAKQLYDEITDQLYDELPTFYDR